MTPCKYQTCILNKRDLTLNSETDLYLAYESSYEINIIQLMIQYHNQFQHKYDTTSIYSRIDDSHRFVTDILPNETENIINSKKFHFGERFFYSKYRKNHAKYIQSAKYKNLKE
eukprot:548306_1